MTAIAPRTTSTPLFTRSRRCTPDCSTTVPTVKHAFKAPQAFRHRHHADPKRHGTLLPCCAAARKGLPRYSLPPPSLVAQTWTRLRELAAYRRLSDQNDRVGSWDARPSSSKRRQTNHRAAAAGAQRD